MYVYKICILALPPLSMVCAWVTKAPVPKAPGTRNLMLRVQTTRKHLSTVKIIQTVEMASDHSSHAPKFQKILGGSMPPDPPR